MCVHKAQAKEKNGLQSRRGKKPTFESRCGIKRGIAKLHSAPNPRFFRWIRFFAKCLWPKGYVTLQKIEPTKKSSNLAREASFAIPSKAIFIFFLILLIPGTSTSASISKSEIAEKIQAIPLEDHEKIEKFFRKLLFHHPFAYTLFGDKPVSIECFNLDKEQKPQLVGTSSEGYETWKKYIHLFPSSNYLFLFYENINEKFCEITLINKNAFRQIVDKYREKFAEVFGSKVTSQKLLTFLMEKQSLWNTPMKNRDDLIGILLGFEKFNAELFQRREEIWIRKGKAGITKRRTKPSPGYASVEEEFEAIQSSVQSFDKEEKPSIHYMRLPYFMAVPDHQETIQLSRKYSEQRKRITQRYAKGDVLEITFQQLCLDN